MCANARPGAKTRQKRFASCSAVLPSTHSPQKKRFWPPGLPGPALMETLVESQMTRRQARGGFVCSDPCSPRDRGHSWEPVRGPLSAVITPGRPENSVVDFGATLTLSCGLLLARGKLRSTIIPSSRYPDLAPVSRRPRQRASPLGPLGTPGSQV